MTGHLAYQTVSVVDVERIVKKMETFLADEDTNQVRIACLVFAVVHQYPGISLEKLVEGVKGASEWIVAFVADLEKPVSLKDMN